MINEKFTEAEIAIMNSEYNSIQDQINKQKIIIDKLCKQALIIKSNLISSQNPISANSQLKIIYNQLIASLPFIKTFIEASKYGEFLLSFDECYDPYDQNRCRILVVSKLEIVDIETKLKKILSTNIINKY